jgi:hypothetical protein
VRWSIKQLEFQQLVIIFIQLLFGIECRGRATLTFDFKHAVFAQERHEPCGRIRRIAVMSFWSIRLLRNTTLCLLSL